MKYKLVNTSMGVQFDLDISEVNQAKRYLDQEFQSCYNFPSHLSLILMPYTKENFERMLPEFERYVADIKPIEITIGDINYEANRRFFCLKITSKTIAKTQKEIQQIINKYWGGELREKDIKRIQEGFYNKEELKNIKKYGYARTGSLFVPHISLGDINIENFNIEKIQKRLKGLVGHLTGTKIVLRDLGIIFQKDATRQSDIKFLFYKSYILR